MNKTIASLLVSSTLLAACGTPAPTSTAEAPAVTGTESVAVSKMAPVVALFDAVCVQTRGLPTLVATAARQQGLVPAAADSSLRYLRGRDGQVWETMGQATMAVAVTHEGLCSTFTRSGDGQRISTDLRGLISTAGTSGDARVVEEPQNSAPGIETTAFQIYRAERLDASWVMTVASAPDAGMRAMLTFEAK